MAVGFSMAAGPKASVMASAAMPRIMVVFIIVLRLLKSKRNMV